MALFEARVSGMYGDRMLVKRYGIYMVLVNFLGDRF